VFKASSDRKEFVKATLDQWPAIAIVSAAELDETAVSEELSVAVFHADGHKCPRCWQWKTDVGSDPKHSELCARCAGVLNSL